MSPAGYLRDGTRCTCFCHQHPNVLHMMACCQEEPPEPVKLDTPPVPGGMTFGSLISRITTPKKPT